MAVAAFLIACIVLGQLIDVGHDLLVQTPGFVTGVTEVTNGDHGGIHPNTWMGLFATVFVSLLGLMGWIVRHVFMVLLPEKDKVQAEMNERYRDDIKSITETFHSECKAQREHHEKSVDLVVNGFAKEISRLECQSRRGDR